MHDFMEYCLRQYFKTTGWNENNQYSNFCSASRAILEFKTPRGFTCTMSKMPVPLFKNSHSINALPTLSGSIGYLFTSRPVIVEPSAQINIEELIDRFYIHYPSQTQTSNGPSDTFEENNKQYQKDYLFFGRLYIPSTRLEALYTKRFSPNLQGVISGVSDPKSRAASNLSAELHYDAGKWCTELSFSTDGALFGLRGLYNFDGDAGEDTANSEYCIAQTDEFKSPTIAEMAFFDQSSIEPNDYDEEAVIGLKGQWSAGAELYYGVRERSGGVSTGVRYRTLPQNPTQSPLTVTYLFNPIMGHMSAAFAAQVSDDLALCPKFDFNMYSYESDLVLGCEWWQREKALKVNNESQSLSSNEIKSLDEVQGVVKATIGASKGVRLLWEGRYGRCLFSMGVVADLTSRSSPIRSVGLEFQYFSS
ncbi:hypothetical protein G9A89_020360 [Geosiphon pyriformis]|nr:hypothetical protein G9A89_020360 [Geosiphon pyriformis]